MAGGFKEEKIVQGRLRKFTDGAFFAAGAMAALLLFLALFQGHSPSVETSADLKKIAAASAQAAEHPQWENSPGDFYADPNLSYEMSRIIKNWNKKRADWRRAHPNAKSYTDSGNPRIFLISGSQSSRCQNPIGDHLMLRSLKNKQDYCRLHGIEMLHNMLLVNPRMYGFWSKIPIIRAAMVAHPEAEWIWWMDSDAVVTDMEFEHPMERYRDFNFVVHGWRHKVYDEHSWLGINAGVFLIRNSEWSMRFLERWASMSPLSPRFQSFAKILSEALPDRAEVESDDQSALVYLMIKEEKQWADKIYIENQYEFQGFWKVFVDGYENASREIDSEESGCAGARRRYAEKSVSRLWNARKRCGLDSAKWRPFITHFAGCQPCTGWRNQIYSADECYVGMERALDYADDQVMRIYGFRRRPYGYPTSEMVPLEILK